MRSHRVAILALDGVVDLDLAIPVQIFGPRRRPQYRMTLCGTGDHVTTTSGLQVATPRGPAALANADTVIVPGYVPHRPPPFVPAVAARTDDRSLSATRSWALANLSAPLSARDLARHAGLAERTFARRFKAESGTTPLQWILDARIDAARELLETTNLGLTTISAHTGFGTPDNLRLRFRQRLGTTPSEYRATFRLS
jgi:transcriptional regulator GlxA family with amidase domain